MLSTKKQEEDKDDILDVSEFFAKEEDKKDRLHSGNSEEKPPQPSHKKS